MSNTTSDAVMSRLRPLTESLERRWPIHRDSRHRCIYKTFHDLVIGHPAVKEPTLALPTYHIYLFTKLGSQRCRPSE